MLPLLGGVLILLGLWVPVFSGISAEKDEAPVMPSPDRQQTELERMRQRINELERTRRDEQPRVKAPPTESSASVTESSAPETEPALPNGPSDVEAFDTAFVGRVRDLIDDRLQLEERDSTWASKLEDTFLNALQANGTGLELETMVCAATVCRGTVVHDDADALHEFARRISTELATLYEEMDFHLESLESGVTRTEIRIVRDGASQSISDQAMGLARAELGH